MDDPIVEEIRRVRERILEECGGSLAAYMERMREISARYASRMVTKDELKKSQIQPTVAEAR
jgi:hypothetical protein